MAGVDEAARMNPDTFIFISLMALAIVAVVAVTVTSLWLGVASTDDTA